jgi:hypothetical protein
VLRVLSLRQLLTWIEGRINAPRGEELCKDWEPHYLPSLSPQLFRYGEGGCNLRSQKKLPEGFSFQVHMRLLLERGSAFFGHPRSTINGAGFFDHPWFLLAVANMFMRMETSHRTWLKCKTPYGQQAADRIASITEGMLDQFSRDRPKDSRLVVSPKDQAKFDQLAGFVKALTSVVVGTPQARRASRDEIWAMLIKYGRPAVIFVIFIRFRKISDDFTVLVDHQPVRCTQPYHPCTRRFQDRD